MMRNHLTDTGLRSWASLRAAAAADYRLPKLPTEYRFALVRDLSLPCKPLVFPDLPALARSLHRMRKGESIQLDERRQRIAGEEEARLGVLVYARDADRWGYRCLGWAWLDGGGRQTLQDALAEIVPDDGEAAYRRVEGGA